MATEGIKIAQVFARPAMSDALCNAVKTSRTIPTTGWTHLYTKGEVTIDVGEETVEVGNDQIGTTGFFEIKKPVTIKIPLSMASFLDFAQWAILDPNWSSGATVMDIADNIGTKLTGFSLLIYDRSLDQNNNTDTPDVTVDSGTWLITEAIRVSGVQDRYSAEQGIVELNLTAVANDGTGSARGYKAFKGTFTAS